MQYSQYRKYLLSRRQAMRYRTVVFSCQTTHQKIRMSGKNASFMIRKSPGTAAGKISPSCPEVIEGQLRQKNEAVRKLSLRLQDAVGNLFIEGRRTIPLQILTG